jgi:uncharacterized membrane protein YhaH (DUF805 family)
MIFGKKKRVNEEAKVQMPEGHAIRRKYWYGSLWVTEVHIHSNRVVDSVFNEDYCKTTKLSLSLIKHHAIKMYEEMAVWLLAFLTSALH